ncbi:MAG: hypothetical protein FJX72_04045, partial [Armatimonadetes bacterium]|nr:hypothetical protein [Armatimonadota bacterium]
MLAYVRSSAVLGINAYLVVVETDISTSLPSWAIVGLPDAAVQESRERVRSAIRNTGFEFPQRRITINLAPADIRKEGPSFDLPIALGILVGSGQVNGDALAETLIVGELSLDGAVRSVAGVLPITLAARDAGMRRVFVPAANTREAAIVEGLDVLPVESLADAARLLNEPESGTPARVNAADLMPERPPYEADFSDV